MQDRFKFRYLFDNKLYEVVLIDFKLNKIYLKIDDKYPLRTKFDDKKLIQCTGLKDKNGKLIYEGDIVKDLIIPEFFYIVKWFNSGFYLESTITGSFLKFDDTQQEVIGNIYENPELLEQL